MCELLVGLPDVNVLGVDDLTRLPIRVHIETRAERPPWPGAAAAVWVKDRPVGGAGRSAVLRSPGPVGVAQAPLAMPEPGVSGRVVDRRPTGASPRPGWR